MAHHRRHARRTTRTKTGLHLREAAGRAQRRNQEKARPRHRPIRPSVPRRIPARPRADPELQTRRRPPPRREDQPRRTPRILGTGHEKADTSGGRVNEVQPREGRAGDCAPAVAGRGDEADLGRRRRDRLEDRPHLSQGLRHPGEPGLSHKLPQKDGRGGIPRAQGGHLERGRKRLYRPSRTAPDKDGFRRALADRVVDRVRTELLGDAIGGIDPKKRLDTAE